MAPVVPKECYVITYSPSGHKGSPGIAIIPNKEVNLLCIPTCNQVNQLVKDCSECRINVAMQAYNENQLTGS